ncbi:MAG: helix-turn-helix domain-containing protein [Bryobacterales bacterium]|jgi:transcriptional regulator with XRE-family HTH domain|nr:helix-turn-helix domain-containing protein [Bryobacterales bacterium]
MTPFGKVIRKHRIDRDMLLGEMAEALDLSSSYLSQIETGKRSIPADLADKVARLFELNAKETRSLKEAAARAVTEVSIKLGKNTTTQERMLAIDLATSFARLKPEQKSELQKLLYEARK